MISSAAVVRVVLHIDIKTYLSASPAGQLSLPPSCPACRIYKGPSASTEPRKQPMLRDTTAHGCKPQAWYQQQSTRYDTPGHNHRPRFEAFARDRYLGPMSHPRRSTHVRSPQHAICYEDRARVLT